MGIWVSKVFFVGLGAVATVGEAVLRWQGRSAKFVGVCRMAVIWCELDNKCQVWTINLKIGQ